MTRFAVALSILFVGTATAASAEQPYSAPAAIEYPTRVFWGDTHLHTTNSLDARIAGVTLDAEQAYRFARGETVIATSGQAAKLSRPLDFLVVTDHSDGYGVVDQVIRGNPTLLADPELRALRADLNGGPEGLLKAVGFITTVLLEGGPSPLLDPQVLKTAWEQYVETADRFNEPGRFTAVIGYEWTPTISGDKLHRNVLYRGNAETARRVLPFTAAESIAPEDLWAWMEGYEAKTGDRVLALAHNGNLGNGKMFPVEINPNTQSPIDAAYVRGRARWEPLYEVTQIKGDSESHPFLSPRDEFADFENWDRGNTTLEAPKDPQMIQYEYAREALKNGLKLGKALGANPYQFGMVGSTDSHTGLSTADENNFFGKMASAEPSPKRISEPMMPIYDRPMWQNWETSASGYAAVWATENTRAAIWDAMQRREVYATTGPRMTVRFFGGWDFTEADASDHKVPTVGYAKGVPMGAILPRGKKGRAPTFLVAALKDPESGNLDRIQIVKGWLDEKGATREKVFDVVWSDAEKRTVGADGKLTPVGSTVDVARATWMNTIGEAQLVTAWTDPSFDPDESAFYYARVIEIPTPRWTAYDAARYGVAAPEGATMVLQERAYTSPIWYQP